MRYIEIQKKQSINLVAKENATPTQSINEAIQFCKENNVHECDLAYSEYTFGIEQDSDINELIADYRYYENYKNCKKNSL